MPSVCVPAVAHPLFDIRCAGDGGLPSVHGGAAAGQVCRQPHQLVRQDEPQATEGEAARLCGNQTVLVCR